MRLTRRSVNLGIAASLAAPVFSRVARAADDTLKVGMVVPVTGPAAVVGGYALAGAKIALDRVNKSGGVLGKQVELVTEDDQTTNPGAVLAFSKLAAQPEIVAFLGPVRSTQNHAIASDERRAEGGERGRVRYKTALQLARTFPFGVLAAQVCPYCYNTGYSSPGTRCSYCRSRER